LHVGEKTSAKKKKGIRHKRLRQNAKAPDSTALGVLRGRVKRGDFERTRTVRYAIAIEKTATGFCAFVPDLPGCIVTGRSQGEVETETEMKGAIRLHIDGIKEDGIPVPQPTRIAEYVKA
jgi:predicted RNase H-like HicB family nuclease